MQEIEVRIIYADEAKRLLKSSLGRMRRPLSDLVQILNELAVTDVVKNNNMIHSILDEIRTQVTSLQEYLSDNQAETLDCTQLSQRAGGIVELFMQLDRDPSRDIMLREAIIRAETSVVLANMYARRIMAVGPFLERQPDYRPDYRGWDVDDEIKRVAKEFQARFPLFLGYKIKTITDPKGFWIDITDPIIAPLAPDHNKDILKALALKARDFLKRELVNNPVNFCFDTEIYGRSGDYGRIYCPVVMPDAFEGCP